MSSNPLICLFCNQGFQNGMHILGCAHDPNHNVHAICQNMHESSSACSNKSLCRNTVLENMLKEIEESRLLKEKSNGSPVETPTEKLMYRIPLPAGGSYKGEWAGNNFHGVGDKIYPDGSRYVGDFKNGLRHGCGTYHYATGKIYEGMWAMGKRHGYGVLQKSHKFRHPIILFKGEWKEGKRCEMMKARKGTKRKAPTLKSPNVTILSNRSVEDAINDRVQTAYSKGSVVDVES